MEKELYGWTKEYCKLQHLALFEVQMGQQTWFTVQRFTNRGATLEVHTPMYDQYLGKRYLKHFDSVEEAKAEAERLFKFVNFQHLDDAWVG